MTSTTRSPGTTRPTEDATPSSAPSTRLFTVLVGIAALAVVLQGVWAGIFLEHDGARDASASWIDVHARGGEIAILFAAAATVLAIVKLRVRKDLVLGGVVLTVLLVLESYLGGLIRDDGKDTLTAVHVPLAMAILAVAVWLPTRARRAPGARRT